jgi:pSer/pThr/pTyr-binding forkhead associated (FHA) protein
VVATVDRRQFERSAPAGLTLPEGTGERRFALDGPALRIGRRRGSDEHAPEIDLGQPPEDPGVSRLHAVLERQQDGSYAVRDLGSTNGTTVNNDSQPVGQDDPVRLGDGDCVRVGAWTTLTIRAV